MEKLIRGIVQFRETRRAEHVETFGRLALGQKPDALFIACSDSRVAVNVFASTDPGDLFVVRNVGNLVPPYEAPGADGTSAAVDFAVDQLRVRDIVVCGHSDCGAMHALCGGLPKLPAGPLRTWLGLGAPDDAAGADVNQTSRRNVLFQIRHLLAYPSVARSLAEGRLQLHALWFDIRGLEVLYYEQDAQRWSVIDRGLAERVLQPMRPAAPLDTPPVQPDAPRHL